MTTSLKDEHGFYYGGMKDGTPVRYRSARKETKISDDLADLVIKQLRELGFGEWKKETPHD